MGSTFKIDTKGICLLCRSTKNCGFSYGNSEENLGTAFKMLLHYLKLDVKNLTMLSVSTFAQKFSCAVNFSVVLCEDCSSIARDFVKFFQCFEDIQQKLDWCVRQLHKLIDTGDRDLSRVQEFERRMNTGNFEDVVNLSLVESLRKELTEKALQKVNTIVPKISVPEFPQPLPPDGTLVNTANSVTTPLYLWNMGELEKPVGSLTMTEGTHANGMGYMNMGPCYNVGQMQPDKSKLKTEKAELGSGRMRSIGPPPPSISGYQMEPPMAEILGRGTVRQCPLCNKKKKDRGKFQVRFHLCQKHFEEVIEVIIGKYTPARRSVNRNKDFLGNQLMDDESKKWKCDSCIKYFNQKCHLETHQYQMHMMNVLKGRIPPSISEQNVGTALNRIVARATVVSRIKYRSVYECPLCKKKEGYSLKVHLLRSHLDQVVREVEEILASASALNPYYIHQ